MSRLRVGLIGCGMIGRFHARDAAADDRLDIVAYADIRPEAAEDFLDTYGGERTADNPEALIADDSLDVIVVATHHDSHAPLTIAAAQAGHHVLVEKPMALTVADCDRMLEAVERAGAQLAINYKFRLEAATRQARAFVPDPRLLVVELAMPRITSAAPDYWVWDPVRGGGLVIATGTHLLDLVSWCARSEPIRVSAAGVTVADHPAGFGDGLVGTVHFRSGAVASVILANLGDNEVLSKWSCQLFDGARSATVFDRLRKIETWGADAVAAVPGPRSMLSSLADAILTGAPVEAGGMDGRRATLLATGLMEAARTSRVVELI